MNIGVFFGSFNPIHLGHIGIAERFLQEDDLDEVWLSVSPHNPLKVKDGLLDTDTRVQMARLAVGENSQIKVVDFEKEMPQPSYTYEALLELQKQYPQHRFILLIGGDNCGLFDKWRNYNLILDDFDVWAYPRNKSDVDLKFAQSMRIIEAPLLDYASTDIRAAIHQGVPSRGLSPRVLKYIADNNLYVE